MAGSWSFVLLAFLMVRLGSQDANAQEIVRVGSYVQEASTGISQVIKPWVDAVRNEVGDQIELREYWGGVLGRSPHKQYELVRNGVVDITWVLSAYTSGQFPELGLFELPFLFQTAEESSLVGWKLHERGLLTGFDGVHLIGFFTTEPNALFLREPISSLDELGNRKIRSLGAIHANWLRAFGASAQTLSAVDMNQALSRGIIDGVIQGWTGMRTFKTFPLVEQSWSIPLGSTAFLLLINQKTWDKLSSEVQKAMMHHGALAFAGVGGRAYSKTGASIRELLKREGQLQMRLPDAAQREAYVNRTHAVHQWWINKTPNGQAVYDAALDIVAQMRTVKRNVERLDHARQTVQGAVR